MQFTPDQSFLQLGIWGNPIGEIWGTHYDLKVLTEAGFNTMWPWAGTAPDDLLEHGRAAGLQVILMHAVPDDALAKIKDHPNLLGNVWMDEPTGSLWGKDMEGQFRAFLEYKAKANRLAPNLRVFINDVPWIDPPATEWWTKWNTAGDVSCHDNYPIKHSAQTRSIQCDCGHRRTGGGGEPSAEAGVADRRRLRATWRRQFSFPLPDADAVAGLRVRRVDPRCDGDLLFHVGHVRLPGRQCHRHVTAAESGLRAESSSRGLYQPDSGDAGPTDRVARRCGRWRPR